MPEIVAGWRAVEEQLGGRRDEARAQRDARRAERIERRPLINDLAYFVLCWGQLEIAVNDKCRAVVRRRQAERSWDRRRAWDLYNPDNLRLTFEDRVALLADRGSGRGGTYNRILFYYNLRNRAAHGAFDVNRIDIERGAAEFQTLVGRLAT